MFILGVEKPGKNAVYEEGGKFHHLQGSSVNDIKELFPHQFRVLAQKVFRKVYIM